MEFFLIWQNKPRCAYRIGSFTPTPSWGSPPTLTASGMHFQGSLVHLLDGGARGGSAGGRSSTPRESSRHPPGHPSCTLVQLGDDGVANLLQLLLLVLKLLLLGRLQEKENKSSAASAAGQSPGGKQHSLGHTLQQFWAGLELFLLGLAADSAPEQ